LVAERGRWVVGFFIGLLEEEGERRNSIAEEGEKEQLEMTCSIDSGVVG
jgi:hypothetical protein